ncbi:MAG: BamA/TamA family outer membrane protein [Cytophagales bacterium]|nr:BamA/TamA family outer membrane protein [Cytophagales bacterium]
MKKYSFLLIFSLYWFSSFSQEVGSDSSRIVQIRDVHIVGNKKTKEKIITRELSVEVGKRYPLTLLTDTLVFDRNRIYNTNLFNEVEITVQELGDGTVDLLITVDERWYVYPFPKFKLSDKNFNVWWKTYDHDFNRVNYGIKVTHFNFRGRNEKINFSFQSGFEQRFLFNYRMPYIDKKQQHGLKPEFILTTNNELPYGTVDHRRNLTSIKSDDQLRKIVGGSLLHTFRKNFYDYHFLSLGMVSTHIADTIAIMNPNYFGNGRTRQKFFSLGYGYQNDQRDNVNYPLAGFNFFISLNKTGLGIVDDVDYWTIKGTGTKYWDLENGFYLGNSISGYVSSGNQPFFNLGGLGFDKRLEVRGYDQDLIEGKAYFLTKNSLRKLIWKHKGNIKKVIPVKQFQTFPIALYGKLFADGGYVKSFDGYLNNDRLTDKFIYGLGVGLDLVTIYDLVFRFECSTNRGRKNEFSMFLQADL